VAERVAAAFSASARPQALAAIDALLEQALTLDGARYATPYRFVRALRRRAIDVAAPAPAQAIELLTVHGAKGLESPWVFLMDTDPLPPAADTVTVLIDWPVEQSAPLVCGFVYATRQCPPSLQDLLAREQQARLREELNGLYVAMTRAEAHLVVSATPGASRKASAAALARPSWWQRLLPLSRAWGERPPAPASGTPAAPDRQPVTLWALPTLSAPTAPGAALQAAAPMPAPAHLASAAAPAAGALHEAFQVTVHPASATSQLGEAVHLALQWASSQLDSGLVGEAGHGDAAGREAPRTAALPDITPWAQAAARLHAVPADEAVRLAQAIWRNPACAPFFTGPALRWAGNEVPVAVDGRTLRIDRLVALDGEEGRAVWWVLDYKLHPAPQTVPEYRDQLRAYGTAVRALQPGDDVRCAFITGEGAVVEVPGG
jgi:ATP-dependent helicase/nuclease subunit A